jgi:hypothetical protein
MREENRFPFYIGYHIIAALLLAFAIAFFMLHPYSASHYELNGNEQLWRTFSYVFPKWYFTIFTAAGILALFSFGSYGLLQGFRRNDDDFFMKAYGVALIASILIFAVLYGVIALIAAAFILVPAFVQCVILAVIEWAWLKPSEKAKRKAYA